MVIVGGGKIDFSLFFIKKVVAGPAGTPEAGSTEHKPADKIRYPEEGCCPHDRRLSKALKNHTELVSLLGSAVSATQPEKISPFLIHGGSRAHDTLHLPAASRRRRRSCARPPAGRRRGGRASPQTGAVRQASGFAAGAQRDPQPQAGARLAVRHRRRLVAHPSQVIPCLLSWH